MANLKEIIILFICFNLIFLVTIIDRNSTFYCYIAMNFVNSFPKQKQRRIKGFIVYSSHIFGHFFILIAFAN
jgi:hypothetical protein